MNVNGIGAAGYPAAGYETRRTGRNVAGGRFAEQAAEAAQATATLHGADEGSGDIAISSWADVVSGSSISVYKTQDFDASNPVYKVRTWDKALAETGVNPLPMNCISTALVLQVESGQQGLSSTFLGDSIGSAKSMAERIIHRLENPLTPAANPDFAGQELMFYKKFLEFLG